MKATIIAILFCTPFFAKAQCNQYLNVAPEVPLKLLSDVQSILGFEMRRTENPFSRTHIVYIDSLQNCYFSISAKTIVTYEGVTKKESEPLVNQVFIKGPADRIMKLFEYFKEKNKSCTNYKTQQQWIMFDNVRIYWDDIDVRTDAVPLKTIVIEKQ